MPTGYTAGVQDGTITELEPFVMRCARAMGALVSMRDMPSNAPIPKVLEARTDYNAEALQHDRTALDLLKAMTVRGCDLAASESHAEAVSEFQKSIAKTERHRLRYKTMTAKVEAWRAPSSDHAELKRFMLKQLQESIEFDCHRGLPPERMTGPEWLAAEFLRLNDSISHHEKAIREEGMRVSGRNDWLKELRESLTE